MAGEQITVLAGGAATGSYEIFRQAGPEGSGPPPHSHPWDEAFYVIAGQVMFGIDGDDNLAPPGTSVLHRCRSRGLADGTRFRRPAGGAAANGLTIPLPAN